MSGVLYAFGGMTLIGIPFVRQYSNGTQFIFPSGREETTVTIFACNVPSFCRFSRFSNVRPEPEMRIPSFSRKSVGVLIFYGEQSH